MEVQLGVWINKSKGENPDRCSTKPVDALGRVFLTRTLQIQALLFLSNLVVRLVPEHATNLSGTSKL